MVVGERGKNERTKINVQGAQCCPKKRQFGKYARCATAIFAEDWQITEEEFLSL